MQLRTPSTTDPQAARERQNPRGESSRSLAAPELCSDAADADEAAEFISYERGLAAYHDKRYRDARNLLAHACKLQPKNVAFKVAFLLAEGMRHVEASEIEAAFHAFAAGYKLDPSKTECLAELLKCRELIQRKKSTRAWWARVFGRG